MDYTGIWNNILKNLYRVPQSIQKNYFSSERILDIAEGNITECHYTVVFQNYLKFWGYFHLNKQKFTVWGQGWSRRKVLHFLNVQRNWLATKIESGNVLLTVNVIQRQTVDLLLRGWTCINGDANSHLFSCVTWKSSW